MAAWRMVDLDASHFFLDSHRAEVIREIARDLAL
jgi:surfactin synthase thioesterase subunit